MNEMNNDVAVASNEAAIEDLLNFEPIELQTAPEADLDESAGCGGCLACC